MKMSSRYIPFSDRWEYDEVVPALGAKLTIGIMLVIFGFPIYYGIVGSTMTRPQLMTFPPRLIPGGQLVENYSTVLLETRFLRSMVNSLIFAGGSTIGLLLICAPAGYAFAKYRFGGRRLLMLLIIAFLAVPFQLVSIPLFKIAIDFGLLNTFAGAILPAMAAPVGVFFMKQNIEQVINDDLMNSGRVDGASEFQVFLRIVLPQLKPGLMALGIWMFITRMKAYYWPLIILREPEVQVAQVWITALLGSGATPNPYPVILPAGVLITLPLLVLFFIGQKYFIRGLTSGAIKG
jgi:ABC-type glycerol-3-phosphate transport system permease component